MGGLDKIVENILSDANNQADEIIKEADNYCDEFMADVKEKTAHEIKDITNNAARERSLYEEKIASSADFRRRNAILKAKGEVIDEAMELAKKKLITLPDEEYFEILLTVLADNIQKGDGKMLLSSDDFKKVNADFSQKVNELASKNQGQIEVVDGLDRVDNGFILVYGDIEENCTFDAMFEAKKEEMRDVANKELFLSDK